MADIAIRVRTIGQLFNSFDPSPFREKDLDDDAEDYIVSWARELPSDKPFAIVIHLPLQEAEKPEAASLPVALANYFENRARHLEHELRELFRIGWRSLMIGSTVLVLCLAASQLIAPLMPNPTTARIVEESFVLVGWVANWRPIEIYLYDWWPIRRRLRLYRRIAASPVTLNAVQM
jgi:hypothetical protein